MSQRSNNSLIPILAFGGLAAYFLAKAVQSGTDGNNSSNASNLPDNSVNLTFDGSVKGFVTQMLPYAIAAQKITGMPPIVAICFSAIESGWGKHAPGNNFFGVKAGSTWTGATQLLTTFECGKTGNAATDGIKDIIISIDKPNTSTSNASCNTKGYYTYHVKSKFRAYASPATSLADFGLLIKNSSRYANSWKDVTTPLQMGLDILSEGYATAPSYADLFKKVYSSVDQYI